MGGARWVELWSDTRFTRAHRLYEGRGYVRGPDVRELGDRSATREFFFRLSLPVGAESPPRGAPAGV